MTLFFRLQLLPNNLAISAYFIMAPSVMLVFGNG